MATHPPAAVRLIALLCLGALLLAACEDGPADRTSTPPAAEPGVPTSAPSPTSDTGAEEEPVEVGASTPSPEGGADVEREMEQLVAELVNDERQERGLAPLEWDAQLAELARGWSRQMADEDRLEHQDPEVMLERSSGFDAVGENIFQAVGPVPTSTVHVGWMRSEDHRRNVLSPTFDHLGVGIICTEDGELWATQRFGAASGGRLPALGDDVPPEEPIVASEGQGPRCPGSGGAIDLG